MKSLKFNPLATYTALAAALLTAARAELGGRRLAACNAAGHAAGSCGLARIAMRRVPADIRPSVVGAEVGAGTVQRIWPHWSPALRGWE